MAPDESGLPQTCLSAMRFLALEKSQQLVTTISNNCKARGNCGLWWARAVTRHCNMRLPTKPPSAEGGVAHMFSKFLNSKATGAESVRDAIQEDRVGIQPSAVSFMQGPCETL